ncbi:hypothetical protein K2Z84_18245 [Candidatus Binatia bacterium]|nr:hypothetical protein [Candidatus Binatia bacterium]
MESGATGDGIETGREPLQRLAVLLLVVALALIGVWTVRRTTWYLAIDQFGYLTFARDLASGKATHDWSLLPALQSLLPATEVDVYAQTYVRRGAQLYCRYAPGFPAILAAVRVLFGPSAEHLVNPIALVLLLALVFATARRLWGSSWIGLGCALLTALLPNYVLLWSTSPLRDVPAHLIALSGLYLLLPGGRRLGAGMRVLLAGLLLGYAATTRIDAALYLLAAAGIGLLDRARLARRILLAGVGFAAGIAPLLAYNAVATGNPLRPTQAMELNSVLSQATSAPRWLASVLTSPDVAHAGDAAAGSDATRLAPAPSPTPFSVQGGGLRLSNFARTMPENAKTVREAMGDLVLTLALIGAVAALRRPVLFLLVVPYVSVAFLFFSMWTLPGPRYLTGVLLLLPLLAVEGACTVPKLVALVAARAGRVAALLTTIVVLAALALVTLRVFPGQPSALPWVERAFAAAIVAGCLAASVSVDARRRNLAVALVLGLSLAIIFGWRSTASLDRRATFQQAQVARARATIEAATDYPAVVLTSTQIGRPAENINYYTNVDAVYLEELVRWQAQPRFAVAALLKAGFAVYLLLPPAQAKQWLANSNIADWYDAETVRSIAPRDADEFFVASPYHTGIALDLVRLDRKRPAR